MSEASKITRRARSNLAFALRILPRARRADAVVFYAFCRTLDDLADEPGIPAARRAEALNTWKHGLERGFDAPTALQIELIELRERLRIPNNLLTAIVDGCMMDLEPLRFQSWQDLDAYIWKVACAVGLVSIRIFGCKDPASEPYAIALGRALQLTNILRDVAEDFANGGRIYLPLDEMNRCGCSVESIARAEQDDRFLNLMNQVADRAADCFRDAETILPAADHRALAPARMMADIYRALLESMRRDGFRVFGNRYRVSRPRKLWILLKHLATA